MKRLSPLSLFAAASSLLLLACESPPPGNQGSDGHRPLQTQATGVDQAQLTQLDVATVTASAEQTEKLIAPQLAEGIVKKLWANNTLTSAAIGIDVDNKGQLYFTHTNRQRGSEFDIRGHSEWETDSIAIENLADKLAFFQKWLSPARSDDNEFLGDFNRDGSRDWHDLGVQKDQVFRLWDSDGDGRADSSQLVVEDFNDVLNDTAGTVLAFGDELYVGAAPDVWRMRDKDGNGVMDEKTAIAHGAGLHIGFGGHGLSGLELGPDGRIYWGIGDIGFSGGGSDGRQWHNPHSGIIARSNPDGSDFELFATGVRNTHEFVFDAWGNLISVDNDGDHDGEKERIVYLTNGSDSGWRTHWQFGKYRDPRNNSYKVWMDERYFTPRFPGQAAFITPPVANYVSGPAGMLYNPGTALSPRWRNTFFVVEFNGAPARSGIHAFHLEADGAGFALKDSSIFMRGILATGLAFGPDGALYLADWIDGWGTSDNGRIWTLDDEAGGQWPARQHTAQTLARDLSQASTQELGDLLADEDMRVRMQAQFALVDRGKEGLTSLEQAAGKGSTQFARLHGLWGIAQYARLHDGGAAAVLPSFLQDQDPEIRAQSAKMIGDVRYPGAAKALINALADPNPRVRFFAAEALGRNREATATPALIAMLASNNDADAYLRHAASLALARIGAANECAALAGHPLASVRLAAVVALRRMQSPKVANFLKDVDESVVTEAARAINDDAGIADALPALGDSLLQAPFSNEAFLRRAINANLEVGTAAALNNLLSFAAKDKAPLAMREEALAALATWRDLSVFDRVDGRYRGQEQRDGHLLNGKVNAALNALATDASEAIRIAARQTQSALGLQQDLAALLGTLRGDKSAAVREAALDALVAQHYKPLGLPVRLALKDADSRVRIAGLELLDKTEMAPAQLVELLSQLIANEQGEEGEKQAAVLKLGTFDRSLTAPVFSRLLDKLATDDLDPAWRLELAEAIAASGDAELQTRLHRINEKLYGKDSLSLHRDALYGGDDQAGAKIFFEDPSASCIRCHGYNDFGGDAGPKLNGVALRLQREQLLQALVDPSARIAPGFGFVTLTLKDGSVIGGVLAQEKSDSLLLEVAGKEPRELAKADIQTETRAASSMPNMSALLSKRQIRDLVAFLASLKQDHYSAAGEGHGKE